MTEPDSLADGNNPATSATTAEAPERWRRSRRWLVVAFVVGLAAVVVAVERPWRGGDTYGPVAQVQPAAAEPADLATGPEIGRLAPNFRLRTMDGGELLLSDLRGRPVFLNFWATWCIYCITEMPAMQRLADRYGDDIVIVGVNVGEEVTAVQRFAEEAGVRYLLPLDSERSVTKAYRARAMPTSLFLDEAGVVRAVKYGVLTPPEMEALLAPLLATSENAER